MQHTPKSLLVLIETWSDPAQSALLSCRSLFHTIATRVDIGPLDETLKWGQPSWRPIKPRTGSTLRLNWSPKSPTELAIFVDCKTDLAARMQTLYPHLPANDGGRRMAIDLNSPLPETALSHLAEMTFSYHTNTRTNAQVG
jgi:hypothetical protein